jgi:hypothetical protein
LKGLGLGFDYADLGPFVIPREGVERQARIVARLERVVIPREGVESKRIVGREVEFRPEP